jgi:hypothetical protein
MLIHYPLLSYVFNRHVHGINKVITVGILFVSRMKRQSER